MRPEPRFCWEASFLGGPIGGETRLMSERPPLIRIPVMVRRLSGIACYSETSALPTPSGPMYDTAEYQLERTYGAGSTLVYRWVDPTPALRKQLAALQVKADKYDAIRKALA